MHEILFRGKRIDNGEWIKGGIYFQKSDDVKDEAVYIIGGSLNDVGCAYPVYPESVSECTGLTDKNGKKIFEGDIVSGALRWLEKPKNGVVAFKNGSFGLLWYRGEIEQFNAFTSMCNITYEVIGNIHDNPELLKGGADE